MIFGPIAQLVELPAHNRTVRGSTPLGPTIYSHSALAGWLFLFQRGNMITVYVLFGKKRYVGITNNIARRIAEHKRKSSKGSQVIGEFKLLATRKRSL